MSVLQSIVDSSDAKYRQLYIGVSETDALTNEIFKELYKHVMEKAFRSREFKSQWRAMTLGLQIYFPRDKRDYPEWRSERAIAYRRRLASNWSIDLVLQQNSEPSDPEQSTVPPAWISSEVADPLIEFILESYGYTYLPSLLDAFETHGDWEVLAPAVFGISANELEEKWHTFLKEQYPQPEE